MRQLVTRYGGMLSYGLPPAAAQIWQREIPARPSYIMPINENKAVF